MLKRIISFGYKRGAPEEKPGTLVVDLRHMFINPYYNKDLRPLNGKDEQVKRYIRSTPNYKVLYLHLAQKITLPGIDVVWLGCLGGKHRGPALAEMLGQELGVEVQHRDIED